MALKMLARKLAVCVPVCRTTLVQRHACASLLQCAGSKFGSIATAAPLPQRIHFGRSFAVSSTASSSSDELAAALEREIEYERKENPSPPEEVPPPAPWELKEEAGDSVIMLERDYQGEKVVVELDVSDQDSSNNDLPSDMLEANDEQAEPEVDISIDFNASVVKGDKALTFELTSDGSYLQINHVGVESTGENDIADSAYTGPLFEELDGDVQKIFEDYLQERGINAEFGEYLLALADNKEQREYTRWLGEVRKFLTA